MDASLQQQLTLVAIGMSAAALFFSLIAAFPGLKSVLAAVRDGVLWFGLFLALGAGGLMVWQNVQQPQAPASASNSTPARAVVATPPQLRP